MTRHQPTRSYLLLLLALLLGGCAAQAMPPVSKPISQSQTVQLISILDTNAILPFNQVNFYAAQLTDTNWTLVGSSSTTNGALMVTNSQLFSQPFNSTWVFASEVTNTSVGYPLYASDYTTITNKLGVQPSIALSRPLTINIIPKIQ